MVVKLVKILISTFSPIEQRRVGFVLNDCSVPITYIIFLHFKT